MNKYLISEIEAMDIHICGSCRGEFHDLDDFVQHKRSLCTGDRPPIQSDQRPVSPTQNTSLQPTAEEYPVLTQDEPIAQLAQPSEVPQTQDTSDISTSEPMTLPQSGIDNQQVVEISQTSSMEFVVSVMNSPHKVMLNTIQPQTQPDHVILPQHQQEQLRQILDAQKVDLSGIDMSKVIVLNPQNTSTNLKRQPVQPTIQPKAQKPQTVTIQPLSNVLSTTNAGSAPSAGSASNLQIFTVEQFQKLVAPGTQTTVFQTPPENQAQTLQVVNAGEILNLSAIRGSGGGGGDAGAIGGASVVAASSAEVPENVTVRSFLICDSGIKIYLNRFKHIRPFNIKLKRVMHGICFNS